MTTFLRNVTKVPYVSIKNQKTKYVPTGYETIDLATNDMRTGTVWVVSGRPGEGKSTFVHRVIVNAIDKGFKTLIVDGEHDQEDLINMLYRKVIGNDRELYRVIQCNKRYEKEPKQHVLEQLQEWHRDKLTILSKHLTDIKGYQLLFDFIKNECDKGRADFVVLDNLMSLVDSTQFELFATQSKFMSACCSLAKTFNVCVLLVAHPNGTLLPDTKMDYYQISGNKDIPNLADVIIQIGKSREQKNQGTAWVLKNRKYGEEPEVELIYDTETKALLEVGRDRQAKRPQIDWRKEGSQCHLK